MPAGTLFPIEIDWQFPFVEKRAHRTMIASFHSGKEQRTRTRGIAARRVSYRVTTLDERESGLLESLIHGGQHRLWYVPIWPHYRKITSNLAIGGVSVGAYEVTSEYVVGRYVMLYNGPHSNEILTITSIAGTTLGVSAATKAWNKRNTKIVPVAAARLGANIVGSRTANFAREMGLEFDLEVWNAD